MAKAPDTPQAGKHELEQFEEAGSSAKMAKVTPQNMAGMVRGDTAASSSQAMDESTKSVHEPPEFDSSSKAPKQTRMQVISFVDMREDMDPNLTVSSFGEEVVDSLNLMTSSWTMTSNGMMRPKKVFLQTTVMWEDS